jgi:hypothetical protein
MRRVLMLCSFAAICAAADPPVVPEPPKTDMVYLLSGDDLAPTDASEAQVDVRNKGKKNEESTHYVPGEHANAKTPLSSPIFVIKRGSLSPEALQVFAFEIKNGRREVTFSKKKSNRPLTMTIIPTANESVFRMEVDQNLPPGEYAITPNGSEQVFCFAVY